MVGTAMMELPADRSVWVKAVNGVREIRYVLGTVDANNIVRVRFIPVHFQASFVHHHLLNEWDEWAKDATEVTE